MRSPNAMRGIYAVEAVMIMKDVASALENLGQKHSEAPCVTHAYQSISELKATLSSMMVKLTPVSDWRTTASLVTRVGQTMIFSSSSSSPST
jgi:hypothetical protein